MENLSFMFGFLILVWIDALFLRKSGHSGLWAVWLAFTGPFGLLWLALTEWPSDRELSWRRLKMGEHTEADFARVEKLAVRLEMKGEWKLAAEAFLDLERGTPDEIDGRYYRECLERLRNRAAIA